MREVLDGGRGALVSEDCPRALHEWLRREIAAREGVSRVEAAARAARFVTELFFAEAARFDFVSLSPDALVASLDPSRSPSLSLEDAWELAAARSGRTDPCEPPVVVTADAGFLAAVPDATRHPREV